MDVTKERSKLNRILNIDRTNHGDIGVTIQCVRNRASDISKAGLFCLFINRRIVICITTSR